MGVIGPYNTSSLALDPLNRIMVPRGRSWAIMVLVVVLVAMLVIPVSAAEHPASTSGYTSTPPSRLGAPEAALGGLVSHGSRPPLTSVTRNPSAGSSVSREGLDVYGHQVAPGLSVVPADGVSASGLVIQLGQTVYFNVTSSLTGPLNYNWSQLPPGCASQDVPSLPCIPSSAGNFGVSVIASNASANETLPSMIEVVNLTSVSIRPTTMTLAPGQRGNFSATIACTGTACSGPAYNSTGPASCSSNPLPTGVYCTWSLSNWFLGNLTTGNGNIVSSSYVDFIAGNSTGNEVLTVCARAVSQGGCPHSSSANITISKVSIYLVTFRETGLPLGHNWWVDLAGSNLSSNSSSISFNETDGSYNFTAGAVGGCGANPESGTVTVNGANTTTDILFNCSANYTVTFSEAGLLRGLTWSVTLNGSMKSSASPSSIVFTEANGTYSFTAKSKNWRASPSSGTVTVAGAAVSVSIKFRGYLVVFNETGLSAGANWSVDVSGLVLNVTNTTVNSTAWFNLPNGTYSYSIGITPRHVATPAAGFVKVKGKEVWESIGFVPVSGTVSWVDFIESGLWWTRSGGSWGVELNTTMEKSVTSTVAFQEANGTFPYEVERFPGILASPSSGNVTVSSTTVTLSITFESAYPVEFKDAPFPAGTSWSVTLGGVTNTTTSTNLTFEEPNGTYSYTIHPPSGYSVSPSSGDITVNGQSPIPVTFAVEKSSPSTFLGQPGDEGYILIGVIVAVASVATVILLLRGRGKRPAPSPPSKEEPESKDAEKNEADKPTEKTEIPSEPEKPG